MGTFLCEGCNPGIKRTLQTNKQNAETRKEKLEEQMEKFEENIEFCTCMSSKLEMMAGLTSSASFNGVTSFGGSDLSSIASTMETQLANVSADKEILQTEIDDVTEKIEKIQNDIDSVISSCYICNPPVVTSDGDSSGES